MTRKRKSTLARRAAQLLRALPDADELRPIGGGAQVALPVVGPGWMGMCPVLFTKNLNLIVFVPPELYHTLAGHAKHAKNNVLLRVATGGYDQELVTKAFRDW